MKLVSSYYWRIDILRRKEALQLMGDNNAYARARIEDIKGRVPHIYKTKLNGKKVW